MSNSSTHEPEDAKPAVKPMTLVDHIKAWREKNSKAYDELNAAMLHQQQLEANLNQHERGIYDESMDANVRGAKLPDGERRAAVLNATRTKFLKLKSHRQDLLLARHTTQRKQLEVDRIQCDYQSLELWLRVKLQTPATQANVPEAKPAKEQEKRESHE